jgi:hypothetical protein
MAESTESYFDRLATHGYQPLLHRASGTMRFDIDRGPEGHQQWQLTIRQGEVDVRRGYGDVDDADCVIAGPEAEFHSIFDGRDSFAAAFVRGAIRVDGDHTFAQNLRRLSPPAQIADEVVAAQRGEQGDKVQKSAMAEKGKHGKHTPDGGAERRHSAQHRDG